jgi:hypothetical protein
MKSESLMTAVAGAVGVAAGIATVWLTTHGMRWEFLGCIFAATAVSFVEISSRRLRGQRSRQMGGYIGAFAAWAISAPLGSVIAFAAVVAGQRLSLEVAQQDVANSSWSVAFLIGAVLAGILWGLAHLVALRLLIHEVRIPILGYTIGFAIVSIGIAVGVESLLRDTVVSPYERLIAAYGATALLSGASLAIVGKAVWSPVFRRES